MTVKKIFRNIYRFFCRVYWANRLGELGKAAIIARDLICHNPKGIAIGAHVLIRGGCQLSASQMRQPGEAIRLQIGEHSSLQQGCKIAAAESIMIGKQVMIAGNAFIIDHDHVFDHPEKPASLVRKVSTAPVIIEDGCWLGYGCVILKGVRVGERSVIGANAVVTKDIPPFSVAVGNPARVIKKIELNNDSS